MTRPRTTSRSSDFTQLSTSSGNLNTSDEDKSGSASILITYPLAPCLIEGGLDRLTEAPRTRPTAGGGAVRPRPESSLRSLSSLTQDSPAAHPQATLPLSTLEPLRAAALVNVMAFGLPMLSGHSGMAPMLVAHSPQSSNSGHSCLLSPPPPLLDPPCRGPRTALVTPLTHPPRQYQYQCLHTAGVGRGGDALVAALPPPRPRPSDSLVEGLHLLDGV